MPALAPQPPRITRRPDRARSAAALRSPCRSGSGTGSGRIKASATAASPSPQPRIPSRFSVDPVALTSTLEGVPGEYTDSESGLIYLRARFYDPATAQFLTRDPLESISGDPYGYADGNPIMSTDPTGMLPDWMPSATDIAETSAGIGDAMSFGAFKGLRNALGGGVNECSDNYRVGGYGGAAMGFALGGMAGLGARGGSVVIGRNMTRVRAAADVYGARTYEASRLARAFGERGILFENNLWMRYQMARGATVLDIGHGASTTTSRFYSMERNMTSGYSGYSPVPWAG